MDKSCHVIFMAPGDTVILNRMENDSHSNSKCCEHIYALHLDSTKNESLTNTSYYIIAVFVNGGAASSSLNCFVQSL